MPISQDIKDEVTKILTLQQSVKERFLNEQHDDGLMFRGGMPNKKSPYQLLPAAYVFKHILERAFSEKFATYGEDEASRIDAIFIEIKAMILSHIKVDAHTAHEHRVWVEQNENGLLDPTHPDHEALLQESGKRLNNKHSVYNMAWRNFLPFVEPLIFQKNWFIERSNPSFMVGEHQQPEIRKRLAYSYLALEDSLDNLTRLVEASGIPEDPEYEDPNLQAIFSLQYHFMKQLEKIATTRVPGFASDYFPWEQESIEFLLEMVKDHPVVQLASRRIARDGQLNPISDIEQVVETEIIACLNAAFGECVTPDAKEKLKQSMLGITSSGITLANVPNSSGVDYMPKPPIPSSTVSVTESYSDEALQLRQQFLTRLNVEGIIQRMDAVLHIPLRPSDKEKLRLLCKDIGHYYPERVEECYAASLAVDGAAESKDLAEAVQQRQEGTLTYTLNAAKELTLVNPVVNELAVRMSSLAVSGSASAAAVERQADGSPVVAFSGSALSVANASSSTSSSSAGADALASTQDATRNRAGSSAS